MLRTPKLIRLDTLRVSSPCASEPRLRMMVVSREVSETYRMPMVMNSWYEATTAPRISRGAHSPWYMGTPTDRPPSC